VVKSAAKACPVESDADQPGGESHSQFQKSMYLTGPVGNAMQVDPPVKPVEVDPTLVLMLKEILGDSGASWFSPDQARAVQNVVHNGNQHTLTIMRTGGGKTLLYAIAGSLVKSTGVYVVAVPNRALLEDLKRRMVGYNLDCAEWTSGTDGTFEERPIVFVSADVLCAEAFVGRLRDMARRGSLRGIFMDEVHKWVSETHFRFKLQSPSCLVSLGVPLHLCTATLKPSQEEKLASTFGLSRSNFLITRGSTDRPNLEYKVIRCPTSPGIRIKEVVKRLVSDIKRITPDMKGGELGLVISRSVDLAKEVAGELGCGHFHSDRRGAPSNSQENYMAWQGELTSTDPPATGTRWLSCTPLIDTGNDTRGVRYTFFLEPPFDMIGFQQGAGRTGREGRPGEVAVYFDEYQMGGVDGDLDKEFADVAGVKAYVENRSECRRHLLTHA